MEVLLFGGTTEGRELALWLAQRDCRVTVCVATDYGATLLPEGEGIAVHTGRLDAAGMEELMKSRPFCCGADATHPYAVQVTAQIRACCEKLDLPYRRIVRAEEGAGDFLRCASLTDAAKLCRELPGNILLTTGSKELAPFAQPGLRERCYPRVLPSVSSLEACQAAGFPPKQIIAMQGPFSAELNRAVIRQLDISVLVTKESGAAGGFEEKCAAARDTGCRLIVVERPTRERGETLAEFQRNWEAQRP